MAKIAIIGTAPSRTLAPLDDPSWEIWACSPGNAHGTLSRITVFFEIHSIDVMLNHPSSKAWAPIYFKWLRDQSFPIVMQEINEAVPAAQVYPLQAMVAKFGRNFFQSSVAYMLALAIAKADGRKERGSNEVEEIAIFGVDMAAQQEAYSNQKLSCLRFIELAKERGIKVSIPLESSLGQQMPLYGYDESSPMGRRLQAQLAEVQDAKTRLAADIQRLTVEHAYFGGAEEQLRYQIMTWPDGLDAPLNLPVAEKLVERKAEEAAIAATPPGAPALHLVKDVERVTTFWDGPKPVVPEFPDHVAVGGAD